MSRIKPALTICLGFLTTVAFSQPDQALKPAKPKTVLILGNSMLYHPPAPEIGWQGDWGMAASKPDSDFAHRLIRNLREKDATVVVRMRNIAAFERDYAAYPLGQLDSLRHPDVLIIKISENVDDYNALQASFISFYSRLLDYLDPGKSATRIIVDGFWKTRHVNKLISNYALYNHYPYVSITDLSKDTANTALGLFRNPGVARHPSDKGMRVIEERIWTVLKTVF